MNVGRDFADSRSMAIVQVLLVLLFTLLIRNRVKFDLWIAQRLQTRPHALPGEDEAGWIRQVMSSLRAGHAVDDSVSSAGPAQPGWMSLPILSHAAETGAPVLQSLTHLRSRLEGRARALRRARALTAQARTQSGAIAVLPWLMFGLWGILDPDAIPSAALKPASWLMWGAAAGLSALSLLWIRKMVKDACDPPTNVDQLIENHLPTALLSLSSQLAAGVAAEDAKESAALYLPEPFRSGLLSEETSDGLPPPLVETKLLLQRNIRDGVPIRSELEAILIDIDSRRDARLETSLQKLPIRALAPLFLCSLPAAALVIASLLIPLLGDLW